MFRFRNATAAVLAVTALAVILADRSSAQTGPITSKASKGNLHVLAVGVSQYDREGDLQWADQDAIDHADFWATQKGRLFDTVSCRKLLNKQANRAAILRAMEETVKQSKRGDTVVAPFSGHGTDPKRGEWRFCAFDSNYLSGDGRISASEFHKWAETLTKNGVRVILIVDACFAGALAEKFEKDPLEDVVVLAASQASETSLDSSSLELKGNGIYTRALLEALRGKADADQDGIVTLAEAQQYVSRQVSGWGRKLKRNPSKDRPNDKDQRPMLFRTDKTPTGMPLVRLAHSLGQSGSETGPAR